MDLEDLRTEAHEAVGAKPPVTVNYSHAAMMDFIIANPGASQNEVAAHFGYTASWVSTVMCSDLFQATMAKRRAEIIDPILRDKVEKNFERLVMMSQDLLIKKLSQPNPSDNLVTRVLDISSKAAGYGAREDRPPANPVNINIHLESMKEGLVNLLRKSRTEVIDGEGS